SAPVAGAFPAGARAGDDFQAAPVPVPDGYAGTVRHTVVDPPDATASIDVPAMEPLPEAWRYPADFPAPGYQDPGYQDPGYAPPGYQDRGSQDPGYAPSGYQDPGGAATDSPDLSWPVFPAYDSGGPGSLRAPGRWARSRPRAVLGVAAAAILVAGGTVGGVLASRTGGTAVSGEIRSTGSVSSASAGVQAAGAQATGAQAHGALYSVLAKTARFVGSDLRLSTCGQVQPSVVQCTNPAPAIGSVTFATYPTLGGLYAKYQEIVENLIGHRAFTTVENSQVCGALAPDPAGENTWNHSDQYATRYTVGQLASGKVPTDAAMGRVFCTQEANGSAVMVWTQDSGNLLGYATGSDASHEQVWDWFYEVHHNIVFPGQPGMTGMPGMSGTSMSPSARPTRS
ncbi:MAG TPA: hypothetical protein VHF26_18415, partial [Trebonia sp.]|nr:hypothetical protein [Trebonia sp.]